MSLVPVPAFPALPKDVRSAGMRDVRTLKTNVEQGTRSFEVRNENCRFSLASTSFAEASNAKLAFWKKWNG